MIYTSTFNNIAADMLKGFFIGWPNPPSPQTHLKMLEKSDYIVLAVEEERNRVVGFITAISDGVLSAYIPFLEVLPEYQNRGIGGELVKRMQDKLNGFYMIDLLCDESLQPYYEKLGMFKSQGMIYRNYKMQSGKEC
jgi:ribosomal protein S18 acetylase RimI-like enzyme